MPRKTRLFAKQFKSETVKLVVQGSRKASEAARTHGLALSLLAGWVRQAGADSGDDPGENMTTIEHEDYARLKRDHRELKREHKVLEKNSEILRGDGATKVKAMQAQRNEYPVR